MSAFQPQLQPTSIPHRNGPFNAASSIAAPAAPPGTFAPGTKVQVGNHRVIIEKYLSEGGFAHVYVVKLPKPVDGVDLAVLKRVAVPDKDTLAHMRTEVETMKKLRGHHKIVKYIDSHASQLKGGGYEVFLLMEFCSGGGLIDFMNTRLQNRLTEPEILRIFCDVAEGVATMHYLKPPLLHRDLKVENVLISSSGSSRTYKLCDFGSAAPPRPAATTAAEGRLIEDDVQKNTTVQYRSPEMIDVYRKQPIDEKSDIWALGVLLYKLCYYTTPFEEVGHMAILNAKYKYPSYPVFSDRLKMLIASMLKENPQKRLNIYQVLKEACSMRHKDVPIRDIYAGRTQSESRRNQQLPTSPSDEKPRIGAVIAPPVQEKQVIPDIAPMRRGRPTNSSSHHGSAKPSPSPLRMISHAQTDPFGALDGGNSNSTDEIAARFPTLDQFSILHEKGSKFDFESSSTEPRTSSQHPDLSERVTQALADDAFARPPSVAPPDSTESAPPLRPSKLGLERGKWSEPKPESLPRPAAMVSTGTMTSPSPPPTSGSFTSASKRPIQRFPLPRLERHPSNQSYPTESPRLTSEPDRIVPERANMQHRNPVHGLAGSIEPRSPASSRPSLEGSRPTALDLDNSLTRSKSVNAKPRPVSAFLGSRVDSLRDRDSPRASFDSLAPRPHYNTSQLGSAIVNDSETNISSDVDFLRAREEEESGKKHHKRLSSGSKHGKRSSLPSLSLSGTKNLLAGRFGEAFRKFESNTSSSEARSRSPSPERGILNLTPIAGSEATERSDDGHVFDETEDVSPEHRRELERRRLSQEEKRVANAAAEYRKRLAEKGDGGRDVTRAQSIQNKVQSLLNEDAKPATKTATGYGRFTNPDITPQAKQMETPLPDRFSSDTGLRKVVSEGRGVPKAAMNTSATGPHRFPPRERPTAPPKPKTLRTGQAEVTHISASEPSTSGMFGGGANEDWETNFSKRYPSLSGLELVEREIDKPRATSLRTKEV